MSTGEHVDESQGPSLFPGVFLRGMLMGAADIVPGVSGGTMAFITGIYTRLLQSISAVDLALLAAFFRGDWQSVWRKLDAAFLLSLLLGIALSIFTLAGVISHWLETYPLYLWSFFFGLILASALVLTRQVRRWSTPPILGLLLGTTVAALLGLSPAMALPGGMLSFFFAGFVAICAMILPGVSGSFILVLLGMYPAVLAAISTFNWTALAVFSLGAACGLLAFARLLNLFLHRFYAATMATLTGFLFGSLLLIWPWKLADEAGTRLLPVFPVDYALVHGESAIFICIALMLTGFSIVFLLETRWGRTEQ